jgi:hypothetical protein
LRHLTIAFDGSPNPPHASYGFVRIDLVLSPPPPSPPVSVSP